MSLRFFRRFFGPLLFLLIWAVILGVPRLRFVMLTQAGSDETLAYLAPYALPLAKIFVPRETSPAELAARYPDDARVQVWAVADKTPRDAERDFGPIIERFPREAWLHATYLRFLTLTLRTGRVPGVFAGAPGAIPPETPSNISRADLERAVAVARDGARLEPDNCYFDVMRADCLFALRRDTEALQALREGGRKKRFDDHVTDYTRFFIEANELARPRLFEERVSLSAAALYPHLAHIREVGRLALWRALQLEQRGDWRGALDIRVALLRIGARMRDNDGSLITGLVGGAITNLAMKSNAALPNAPLKNPQKTKFWANYFAGLCRAHGRPDLVAEALRETAASVRFYELSGAAANSAVFFGIPDRTFAPLGATNWAGVALLFQLAITLPAWIALALILGFKRAPGEEKSLGAVLTVYGVVVLLCACAFFVVLRVINGISGGWGAYFWGNTGSQSALIGALRWVVALAPLLIGALVCAFATWWKHRCALRQSDRDAQSGDVRLPPILRIGITGLLLALTLLSIVCAVLVQNGLIAPLNVPLLDFWLSSSASARAALFAPLYMVLVFVAWWIFASLWLLPAPALPLFGSGVKWLRQTLGATLLLSSALYLLVLLVSLQARTQADAAFDNFLRRGEMATLRGTQKAANVR